MRAFTYIKFYLLGTGALFILYSLTALTTAEKLIVFFAYTLLSPNLFRGYLGLRGVKKGDLVLAAFPKEGPLGSYVQKLPARALGEGKIGDTIEVEWGGSITAGEIKSYGGLFFPAEVNILN
jgi:hypothetical protein